MRFVTLIILLISSVFIVSCERKQNDQGVTVPAAGFPENLRLGGGLSAVLMKVDFYAGHSWSLRFWKNGHVARISSLRNPNNLAGATAGYYEVDPSDGLILVFYQLVPNGYGYVQYVMSKVEGGYIIYSENPDRLNRLGEVTVIADDSILVEDVFPAW